MQQYLKLFLGFIFFNVSALSWSQQKAVPIDSLSDVEFLRVMEQSISMYYAEWAKEKNTDSIRLALGYESGTTPVFF